MSVKATENVEAVSEETVSEETTNVETEETETDSEQEESLLPPVKSPEEMFAEMDEANPAKGMVSLARTQLTTSLAGIKSQTERIEEGSDSIEKQIEALISDSEDEAVVSLREDRDSLEAELEKANADLRTMILDANPDVHPLTAEQKSEIEGNLATQKANHKALLSAMEKALAITLGEKDSKYILSDLAVKTRGGSGSGVAKPRFEKATVREEGTETEINVTGDANSQGTGFNISSGHIAEALSTASGQTAAGNRIKPSEVTNALAAAGYDGVSALEIEFAVEGANKKYRIHVTPKSKA